MGDVCDHYPSSLQTTFLTFGSHVGRLTDHRVGCVEAQSKRLTFVMECEWLPRCWSYRLGGLSTIGNLLRGTFEVQAAHLM